MTTANNYINAHLGGNNVIAIFPQIFISSFDDSSVYKKYAHGTYFFCHYLQFPLKHLFMTPIEFIMCR